MKERVIRTCIDNGEIETPSCVAYKNQIDYWDLVGQYVGKRIRRTYEIIEQVPTPAEDWLEFSSRFGGDGKPPARMLKLVKSWEKMHRRYFGRWTHLAGLLLDAGTKREAERTYLRVIVGRLFAESEYEPWMLADRIVRDEEE